MTLRAAGIVGAWSSGRAVHAARWHQRPVNLAGFDDVNADVARQAVSVYSGQGYSSDEQLAHTVDVVQVCTMNPIVASLCILWTACSATESLSQLQVRRQSGEP